MEKCAFLERFSERTLVIVFLNKFSEKKFRKNVDILSRCQTCHVLFVSSTIMPVNNIRSIFIWAHEHNMPYTEFAQLAKDVVELYSRFVTKNCSTEARLTRVWRPGMDLGQINTWAFKLNDLNGCPVSVSSLTFTPKMMIRESENGSLIIVGGREGKLLLTLADKLNFTIALRHPSMADRMKYSRKVAIINDVINGTTEIGIGRLRPTNEMQNRIAVSAAYDDECITWGVPRVLSWKDDIVFMEFSGTVWAAVGVVFVASWVLGYVHRNIVLSENVKRKHVGFFKVLFDALTLHLGNPINHVSFSTGGRCVLIIYLYYAMVITTAYKASLASILATDGGSSVIVDVDGIIKANLTVIGSLYDYKVLKDQENDSVITQRLIERFVVDNNDSAIWDQLTSVDNNYAFLARRSALNWLRQTIAKTQESVTFDVFNNCVLAYHPVVALQKKSVLRKSVNTVIQRLTESGILNHWDPDEHDSERILKRRGAQIFRDRDLDLEIQINEPAAELTSIC
ncbi:uncharacterized protein [Neodiprion pinetum]|uniref:uncharacterized protein n=1 Tax=Neodiprion pinetum TaxID=441929 RepID=UPI00371CAAB3